LISLKNAARADRRRNSNAASLLSVCDAGLWGQLRRRLDLKAEERRLIVALGRFGFVACSLVFAMIGLFLLYAALDSNSREAKGFTGALRLIQHQPHGSLLLGMTAAGLLAFGIYGVIYGVAEAAFGRIATPSPHHARLAG
jgi:hypothetical protein